MALFEAVENLLQNEKQLCLLVVNKLLKIANNILKHPNDKRFRKLNLSSETVEKVLLPAIGALEILFLMGFQEGDDELLLPSNDNLKNVTLYRDQLEQLKRERFPSAAKSVSRAVKSKRKSNTLSSHDLSQLLISEAEMSKELEHHFQQVLVFESPHLQNLVRSIVPMKELQQKAERTIDYFNKAASKMQRPMALQDGILIELLNWFKEEFFSWFDKGFCESCHQDMKFIGHLPANEEEMKFGGHRVEGYSCETCGSEVRFPRYFHPGKLLETRKGRCMEWASCFTLLCRTFGMDARYIWDKTDHVWTEVYSVSQDRWIHADSCENKFDIPLMYEKGWNKKLSYVFGFSKDEIVDCVWRYSANHSEICKRRKSCREDWLASTIFALNKERQKNMPEHVRKSLELRCVREIAEFFTVPNQTKKGEEEGRQSGSLSWRLARCEVTEKVAKQFSFIPTEQEIKSKEMIIKYSSSQDSYFRHNSSIKEIKGWQTCVYSFNNVFRKRENDWKMTYIARKEGCSTGEIKWRFDWSGLGLQLKSVLIVFQHKTFECGDVHWQICSGDLCIPGNKNGVLDLSTNELPNSTTHFEISAELIGGKDDLSWQHAQLFRQKEQDKEFPFFVKISFD